MLLAINTATSLTEIALLDNGGILAENSWLAHNDEAEKLMPAIDELVSDIDKDYSDISQVLVVKGPGSFTGLRVGVTVANTIAYLNKCELFGIDTFEYLWQKNSDSASHGAALLIYAGSGGVYLSLPAHCPNFAEKSENIPISEIKDVLQKNNIKSVFGDITDEQKLSIAPLTFLKSSKSFGQTIAKIDLTKLNSEKIIEPLYIKKPGITVSKKKLI